MRGGGRQKDKRRQREKATSPTRPERKSEEGPKNVNGASDRNEGEVEQKMESYLAEIRKVSWVSKEQLENIEGGVRRAVEWKRTEKGDREGAKRRRWGKMGHGA